jgi:SpoVK/Ycf46/Vps4 family AAA+-type ATPase
LGLADTIRLSSKPAFVILDNIENILVDDEQGQTDHILQRCQSALLTVIDKCRTHALQNQKILFLVTTSQHLCLGVCRFDRIFFLNSPDEVEREALIKSSFLDRCGENAHISNGDEKTKELISALVDASVGRSYAELVQYCRHAVEQVAFADGSKDFFVSACIALRERLHTVTPNSLIGGVLHDLVELRVLCARELLSKRNGHIDKIEDYEFTLLGQSAARAWEAMQSCIVVPLCQSKKLDALLDFSQRSSPKALVGGVLLAGESGCGKSEIAMHCSRYASMLDPSIRLVVVSCTSLVHKEVGSSEKAIKHLFYAVRKAAPCILLMDGIENIAAVRGNDTTTEGTLDRMLSTLLDGVEVNVSNQLEKFAVIGIAQNASFVDAALKRPGRLDEVIQMRRDWD